MSTVISDSSPLIGLSMIDLLDILRDLWGKIIIPDAVYKEVVVEGAGKAGADIVAKACNDWIKVVSATNKNEVEVLQAVLDEGESEVIVLGQELKTDILLLDNREPRLFARTVKLKVIGTVGVIKLAWQKGLIKNPVKELYKLRLNGFWLGNELIERLKHETLRDDK